jgi:hypothetical protein
MNPADVFTAYDFPNKPMIQLHMALAMSANPEIGFAAGDDGGGG